jgi:hypothetical protein
MHDQRSGEESRPSGYDNPGAIVLGILVGRYPALLSVDELVREVAGFSGDPDQARIMVLDGLAELMGDGLAHEVANFVFASRAAVRAAELSG